jgi:hypothetical protein
MSVGYGGQSDPWNWDCDENYGQETQQNMDSNNCWIPHNTLPQNYNYQQQPMV